MKKSISLIFISIVSMILAACTPQYTNPQQGQLASQQINQDLSKSIVTDQGMNNASAAVPADVSDTLVPSLSVQRPNAANAEKKYDISVDEI